MQAMAIGRGEYFDWGDPRASTSQSNGYRIEKIGPTHRPWVVGFEGYGVVPLGLYSREAGKAYASRKGACAGAVHLEVCRVRRLKLARHIVLSVVFGLAAIAAYVTMAAPTQTYRIELFVLALAAMTLALSEGLEALLIIIDEGWDYLYELRHVSPVDRFIGRIIFSQRGRPVVAYHGDEARVRVVEHV